jgi:hypothetical protein
MILLQDISQKLPNAATDSTFSFWMISQVVVTAIIFIGVYYIFKPIFGKKKDREKDES